MPVIGERVQLNGSFDTIAGLTTHMFDFERNDMPRAVLNAQTGAVVSTSEQFH